MKQPHFSKLSLRAKRHNRVRSRVAGTAERPRLSVFKSNKHIYAALINDDTHTTIVSTQDLKMAGKASKDKPFTKVNHAEEVGTTLAKLALAKKLSRVVFDRGGYRYTGRVKAVADGARAGGLIF